MFILPAQEFEIAVGRIGTQIGVCALLHFHGLIGTERPCALGLGLQCERIAHGGHIGVAGVLRIIAIHRRHLCIACRHGVIEGCVVGEDIPLIVYPITEGKIIITVSIQGYALAFLVFSAGVVHTTDANR